jgi:hypothetical protein
MIPNSKHCQYLAFLVMQMSSFKCVVRWPLFLGARTYRTFALNSIEAVGLNCGPAVSKQFSGPQATYSSWIVHCLRDRRKFPS